MENTSDLNGSANSSNFKYKHTLLLYLVYEGFKCGALNGEEKLKMKELIFMKHPIIYTILKKYEENGQVNTFWAMLKDLINNASYEVDSNSNSFNSEVLMKLSEEESCDDNKGNCLSSTLDVSGGSHSGYQLSSPSDAALIRQKKQKRVVKNVEKEFKEKSEQDVKEMHSNMTTGNSFKNLVKKCDQGCSPKITVKKRYNNEDEDGYF